MWRPRCETCIHVKTGNRFCSSTIKESFYARTLATCKTSNVIHLIECKKCQKLYVRETENSLHLRMNGYRSDYYCRLPNKPVAVHFNTPGHTFDDVSEIIIEQSGAARRKYRESYWICSLRSSARMGSTSITDRTQVASVVKIDGHQNKCGVEPSIPWVSLRPVMLSRQDTNFTTIGVLKYANLGRVGQNWRVITNEG